MQSRCLLRVARLCLCAAALPFLSADTLPVDRDDCNPESTTYNYDECLAGEPWMAEFFPALVTSYDQVFATGFMGVLNPQILDTLAKPDGYEIDYSGGLTLPPEDYEPLRSYTSTGGDVAFVDLEVRVIVNDTAFSPPFISILPGTTVIWIMETYESASIRHEAESPTFSSGPLNRNWALTYNYTFHEEGTFPYRNAEKQGGNAFAGRVVVTAYNCSSYTTCTTCLAYSQCLWCGGNGTCMERNVTTNLPLDDEPVVAIPYDDSREYQSIKYMFGYNTKLAIERFDWYPWPPIQRNPRPVQDRLIPSHFDPISSDQCYAYLRTRDASQCDNYETPPAKNRVHGRESADRPQLEDFFSCYDHLIATWAQPDVETPVPWTAWALNPPPPPPPRKTFDWQGTCCSLCTSCTQSALSACNITCNPTAADGDYASIDEVGACPVDSTIVLAIQLRCASSNHSCTSLQSNMSTCDELMGSIQAEVEANIAEPRPEISDIRRNLKMLSPNRSLAPGDDAEKNTDADQIYSTSASDSTLLTAAYAAGAPSLIESFSAMDASTASVNFMEQFIASRRRAQDAAEEDDELTPWEQVPVTQKAFMPKITANMDLWGTLVQVLTDRFGPRCNATHRCDLARGSCLNISGLPIYAFDQNGTCVCHPWFTGDDCSQVLVNPVTCAAMPDIEQCKRIRNSLYACGNVEEQDFLPPICAQQNLTVVECGEAGHMKGNRNASGISNLVGRPEAGFASSTCSKCLSRGEMRMDTYAKLCDRSIVLAACQRHEDATAQRLCNMCGKDTQVSVMPQRGMERGCSYYRGTCIGSVEKRIRGIVPPNADIVGQTKFGGLRYCKEKTTFSSVQHYYTDNDIMQVGQTCQEGTTAVYEGWDWTKQRDHPDTVMDKYGLACEDPDNEATCPVARFCVDASLCYTDTPNWKEVDELVKHWGLNALKPYADDPTCNIWLGSEETAIFINQATSGMEGNPAFGLDEDSDEPVLVPCTFERHKLVFYPSTAPDYANWPFVDSQYIETYTRVEWSLDTQTFPPPPSPPPPGFMVFG